MSVEYMLVSFALAAFPMERNDDVNINRRKLEAYLGPEQRPYLFGVAMASRFVTALLPIPFLLMAAPLMLSWVLYGIPKTDIRGVPRAIWVVAVLALIHVCGLWIGPTIFWRPVVSNIIGAGLVSAFFLFEAQEFHSAAFKLHKGFFDALIPPALFMAALGLIKVAAVARGIVDPYYLLEHSIYPHGSSFASDYNLVGLAFIAAAIGVISRHHGQIAWREVLKHLVLPLVVLCAASVVTSSRRVLLSMPFLAIFWVVLGMRAHPITAICRRVIFPMAIVICATALLSLGMSVMGDVAREEHPGIGKFFRANSPGKVLGTVYDGSFANARAQRWALGVDLLKQTNGVGATGFAYHNAFACKFLQCRELDYPHLFLLSEWLIGGVPAALLSLTFLLLLLKAVVRNGWRGVELGSSVVFLAVLPFSLVSGDTLFSARQLLAAGLLVCAQAKTCTLPNRGVVREQSRIF